MALCEKWQDGAKEILTLDFAVTELAVQGSPRKVLLEIYATANDPYGEWDGYYFSSADFTVTCNSSVPPFSKTFSAECAGWTRTKVFSQELAFPIEKGSTSLTLESHPRCDASVYSDDYGGMAYTTCYLTAVNGLTKEPSYSASAITLGAGSVQMGKNLLIAIDRDDGTCTHTLEYSFGDKTGTIATDVASSYAWEVPDLSENCNNETSGSCTITCKTYQNGSYIGSTNAPVMLTVPDPTVPSIPDRAATMGTSCTIDCKRNASNFSVKLELEFEGTTTEIASGKIDSYGWTPSYELAKLIPALTYYTGRLKCTTFNGTAQVGEAKTRTIQLMVPDNAITQPVFTLEDLTLSPISDLDAAFDGLYLRGITGLKAEFDASSVYSNIRSCEITVGSVSATGNPANIPMLVNEGNVKVIAKVTDARGYATTVNTTVYILPYRKPKVAPYSGYSNVVCERALSTGALDSSGTYLAIRAGKSYSSVIKDGVELNCCSLKYRWKMSSNGSFGEWTVLLTEDSSDNEIAVLLQDIVTSLTTSYDVEIEAEDTLGSKHTLQFPVMTEAVSFHLYDGPDGAGFGKYAEAAHVVDVASHMTLRIRGKLVVDSAAWINLDLADGIIESVYAYGRKEDSGCHYQVMDGNHVYVAFNCAFSFGGSAKVINSTVIPAAHRPPRTVYTLCPINDRGIALVSVSADGYIRVEWVQKLTDTVMTGSADVIWIDGYVDYWI